MAASGTQPVLEAPGASEMVSVARPAGARRLVFAYDVVCPYAYLASRRVAALGSVAGLAVEWLPVLLGGLYASSQAPQGAGGSATDVFNDAKKALSARDLAREAQRWGVPLNWNARHPVRSVEAQRLQCAVADGAARERLAHALFHAYWVQGRDISDAATLHEIASQHAGVPNAATLYASEGAKAALRANTEWIAARGGFGVPCLVATDAAGEERLFFGQDRTFFAALHLGVPGSHPLARPLQLRPVPGTDEARARPRGAPELHVYHDFSSPWSFLGSTQALRMAGSHGAALRWRPVLLGALFKAIGTPNVPMLAISEAKRAYGSLDLADFAKLYGNIQLRFPEGFPIRTVLPLRVSLVEPKTVPLLYHAAWVQGRNIGEERVLREVLAAAGLDADRLMQQANAEHVKEELKSNTLELEKLGGCGVPTWQVRSAAGDSRSEIVWGQDRLNVVSDMLAHERERSAAAKM